MADDIGSEIQEAAKAAAAAEVVKAAALAVDRIISASEAASAATTKAAAAAAAVVATAAEAARSSTMEQFQMVVVGRLASIEAGLLAIIEKDKALGTTVQKLDERLGNLETKMSWFIGALAAISGVIGALLSSGLVQQFLGK